MARGAVHQVRFEQRCVDGFHKDRRTVCQSGEVRLGDQPTWRVGELDYREGVCVVEERQQIHSSPLQKPLEDLIAVHPTARGQSHTDIVGIQKAFGHTRCDDVAVCLANIEAGAVEDVRIADAHVEA